MSREGRVNDNDRSKAVDPVIDDWPSWPVPLSEGMEREIADTQTYRDHHTARLPPGWESIPVMMGEGP